MNLVEKRIPHHDRIFRSEKSADVYFNHIVHDMACGNIEVISIL